jgi:hypothetical protein
MRELSYRDLCVCFEEYDESEICPPPPVRRGVEGTGLTGRGGRSSQ